MGCGASTAKVATEEEDALEMTRPRADGVVPADGRTWKNTGKMTPARALTVLENRWPNMVLRFPPLDPNEPPAYKGDDWGDDVTYDCARAAAAPLAEPARRRRCCAPQPRSSPRARLSRTHRGLLSQRVDVLPVLVERARPAPAPRPLCGRGWVCE